MQTKFGTVAALSLFVLIFVAYAWAIAQQDIPQQDIPQQSPTPAQDQFQQQASQTILQSPQQDESIEPRKPKSVSDDTQLYMHAKLANSQKVMEGLVTENFALIEKGAKQMKKISEAAHWPNTVDEVYQHYSVSFRKQCDKLAEQAKKQDLQAVHYTYLHMSTTCIDCHSYVRGRFRVEQKKNGGPVMLIPTHWEGSEKQNERPQPDSGQDKNG